MFTCLNQDLIVLFSVQQELIKQIPELVLFYDSLEDSNHNGAFKMFAMLFNSYRSKKIFLWRQHLPERDK